MKKILTIIMIISLFSTVAFADEIITESEIIETNIITEPYEYPITPGMDEWNAFEKTSEMIAACQIPEEMLTRMTTDM